MVNPLVKQYGIQALKELNNSPYKVLYDSKIEPLPHQVEAFIAALGALRTGGIILADEVGLGKTIEAGLVIKYLIKNGAKRILIAMPNALRRQWQDELENKFQIESFIPENKYSVNHRDAGRWKYLTRRDKPLVVIVQYGMADFFINKFPEIVWDCFVFDEAHRLRNLGKGTQMPLKLFHATKGVPKIMLTATPLQNNLRELYALSRFIDEKIFIDEETFNRKYAKNKDYDELKKAISPIMQRTLRREVSNFMKFSERYSFLIDFKLTKEEFELYELANAYLQKPVLYAVTVQNNGLVKMVVRKLLASSSFAVVETFEKLKNRLLILKEGTRIERAEISIESFFEWLELDDDDDDGSSYEEDFEKIDRQRYKSEIETELREVENIIEVALSIKENSKAKALIEALRVAFELQEESGRPKKALIFTESKRTQKYLLSKLEKAGFENILLFNGEISDPNTKEIYDAWRAMNPDKATNKQSIDMKHAIVEEFRDYADILIATDAASEGLNLQFCDTVINYDLPWNPMKIEQRIGRCHRYGQDRDVAVFNLINTENSADKRVYEILENKFNLFKGVFGASDDALGLLESGSSFEKKIQKIYDTCRTEAEFKAAFDKLERDLTSKQNKKSGELKDILVSISSNKKKQQLKKEAEKIKSYFEQLLVWNKVTENTSPTNSKIIMIENNDVQVVANKNITDGYIFIGSFNKNGTHEFLQPVLAVFDNNGTLVTSDSYYVLQAFKNVPRQKFIDYMPSEEELDIIATIHENIPSVVAKDYLDSNSLTIINNKQRLNKWAKNRIDKYDYDTEKLRAEIEELRKRKSESEYQLEKDEIQIKIDRQEENIRKRTIEFHDYKSKVELEIEEQISEFERQFIVEGFVYPNMVIKF